ncbi:MAG: hypothetical protein MJ014_01485 [Methanocorpusculum sp.]|nr:hypothetical protein [Methanocorpusculum sp.]
MLSIIMVAKEFDIHTPPRLAPVAMVVIVSVFLYISISVLRIRRGKGPVCPAPLQ